MFTQQLQNALTQVLGVVVFCTVVWICYLLISKYRKIPYQNYAEFLGLHLRGVQWNSQFWFLFSAVLLLGASSTVLQYFFVDGFKEFSMNDSSPYWRLLKGGLSLDSVSSAIVYCMLQAGLSEELLFRGLIANRLYRWIGFYRGNIIQSIVFWLPHYLLIGFVGQGWFSLMQLIALVTIIPISLLMGYANQRVSDGSIVYSWTLHTLMNFITFLLLGGLLL